MRRALAATSHLPQDYALTIAKFPGVRNVAPIQVFTNNCRASLDVIVFYGVIADQVRRIREFTLTAGSWDERCCRVRRCLRRRRSSGTPSRTRWPAKTRS